MNLAEFSIERRTTTLVLTALALVGGVVSFNSLGRLEDPEFTIKEAVVMTQYPGASPREVEEEVTERIGGRSSTIRPPCPRCGMSCAVRSETFSPSFPRECFLQS
jgi:multidrug efflux pump subunit AcrB